MGSNILDAILKGVNRLFVSGSFILSTPYGMLNRKELVIVFQQMPSALSGSLSMKSIVFDCVRSCLAMWLRNSLELLDDFVRLNPRRFSILSKDFCNSTDASTLSSPVTHHRLRTCWTGLPWMQKGTLPYIH